MKKSDILKFFSIKEKQKIVFQNYIDFLQKKNKTTNLVGKSTLSDPWTSHILDSLQILPLIKDNKLSILDMGTGAGFPGCVLSIAGFKNITLIDSNGKKIEFLKSLKKEIGIDVGIILGRVENTIDIKYDIITSRALANLSTLLSYSHKIMKKNTVLIFLKGKTVNDEIIEAKKKWEFRYIKKQSISDSRGRVLIVEGVKKK